MRSGYKRGCRLLKETKKAVESKLPIRQALRNKHPLGVSLNPLNDKSFFAGSDLDSDVKKGCVCFYAGKLLDELFRLLGIVGEDYCSSGLFCDTQELWDLCQMLWRHYDTYVGPRIKKQ